MVGFAVIAAPLSKALGLSLVVERVLEVGKNVLEPLVGPRTVRALPPVTDATHAVDTLQKTLDADAGATAVERRAEAAADDRTAKSECLETLRAKLRAAEASPGPATDAAARTELRRQILELTAELRQLERHGEWSEQAGSAIVLSTPATDPDRGKVVKTLVLQLLGFAAGIVLARVAGVALFGTFLGTGTTVPLPLDYILTGLLIGGGSAPMHVLVRFITERRIPTSTSPARGGAAGTRPAPVEAPIAEAPTIIATPAAEDLAGWWTFPTPAASIVRSSSTSTVVRRIRR